MAITVVDLLDPSLLPQDQGWSVINASQAAGNFDPGRPIQASADGLSVTVSSIGLPPEPTGGPSAHQWFYRDLPVSAAHPFSLTVSLRVNDLVQPHNSFDSAAVVYASTSDPTPQFQVTGNPRAQFVYFDEDEIGWGDESQSYALDTTDGFHTYRIDVAPDGHAQVWVDGVLALERDDFEPLERIGFGDMTNDAGLDGSISIADLTVAGVVSPAEETTTYYFNGVVTDTSSEDRTEYVLAGFFDLLPGEVATYTLELDSALLAPNQAVALAWDDPSFVFDVRLGDQQIGNEVFESTGLSFTPNGDLSRLAGLAASLGNAVDGPSVTLHPDHATINTDDDVGARLDGSWIANQPGLPGLPQKDGTDGANVLAGTSSADFIRGLGGNDEVRGNGGNDVLDGGDGDDQMHGKDGHDRLFGQDGDDGLRGDGGDDILFGGAGNDFVRGGSGRDLLFGESGDDKMEGDDGNDVLTGGEGADSLRGETGNDTLLGGRGEDLAHGGSGNDVLAGDDGDDVLNGNDGHDLLNGGLGDDSLFGGSGNDILFGSAGNDYLDGDPGHDIFVLTLGDGHDVIDGFVAGAGSEDLIDLSGFFFREIHDLASTLALATFDGTSTTINFSTQYDQSVTLLRVRPSDLHEDDFVF